MIDIAGQPWFQASSVCKVLGLTNTTVATQRLKEGERAKFNLGLRGLGSVVCITEAGLYKLVMMSRKPEAEEFQDWIAGVVLPAIRKDGGYVHGEENVQTEEDLLELSLRTMDMLRLAARRQDARAGRYVRDDGLLNLVPQC
ncbi:Bro-N domain-containing protein [Roseovarius sp. SYSU LYC5161]|uniref:BRO-N domain-containing protein n=1 Tax=Roseovarius halophilus (ex Wu et al. 2025) TaxID=3376060 RepID=UPI00399BB1FB